MFFGGALKKVDKLGRIVIPMDLRKKYGLTEGIKIEFIDVGYGIIVRASEERCKICHGRIFDGASIPLCEECIAQAAKSYKGQKS